MRNLLQEKRQRYSRAPAYLRSLCWFRADRAISITGLGVSEWKDESGRRHHATQTTDADRPAFNATGWAKPVRPTVDFDAANTEFMSLAGFVETGNDYTVLAVLDPITSPANAAILSTLGTGGGVGIFYQNSAGNVIFFDTGLHADGASNTNPQSITWVLDGAANNVTFYRDGIFQSTAACDGNTRFNDDTRLGMYFGGGQNLDARLAEVLVTSRQLTSSELMTLRTYSKFRYNV